MAHAALLAAVLGMFHADLHVPLTGVAESSAIAANEFLSTQFKNEIDLEQVAQPHITLYLTEFDCASLNSTGSFSDAACAQEIARKLSVILPNLVDQLPCQLLVEDPYAATNYAILNVSLSTCLQFLSDAVVNATHMYAKANQSVPEWVRSLPEPERSEKIAMVEQYGSPNVFSQFMAHVSIGFGSNASAVDHGVDNLHFESTAMDIEALVIGLVGPHGTVLRGHDLACLDLTATHVCMERGRAATWHRG